MIALNRRRYMGGGGGLPYDAEVEYLQTTKGTGLFSIDLDMTADEATDAVEMEFHMLSYATQNRFFSSGDTSDAMEVYIASTNNYSWHRASSDQWLPATGVDARDSVNLIEKYKVDWYNKEYTIRGDTVPFSAPNTPPSSPRLLLFDSLTGSNGCPGIQIYSVKVWREDVLVRDMIPVRVGTKGYLYDCISGRLFGNSGSSDFILGPDLGTRIDLEYLELTGSQWINTMVSLANITNWELELDFSPTRFWNYNAIHSFDGSNTNESWIYSNGKYAFRYNNVKSDEIQLTINTRTLLKVSYNGTAFTVYIDGVQKSQKNASVLTQNYMLWLFRRVSNAEILFYGGKLSINNNQILNLLPVRIGDTGFIYDSISNEIIHNLGSAAFVNGPDKT